MVDYFASWQLVHSDTARKGGEESFQIKYKPKISVKRSSLRTAEYVFPVERGNCCGKVVAVLHEWNPWQAHAKTYDRCSLHLVDLENE